MPREREVYRDLKGTKELQEHLVSYRGRKMCKQRNLGNDDDFSTELSINPSQISKSKSSSAMNPRRVREYKNVECIVHEFLTYDSIEILC